MELPVSEIIVCSYVAILGLMSWIVRMIMLTSSNAKHTAETLKKITSNVDKIPVIERVQEQHEKWLAAHEVTLDRHGNAITEIKTRCNLHT